MCRRMNRLRRESSVGAVGQATVEFLCMAPVFVTGFMGALNLAVTAYRHWDCQRMLFQDVRAAQMRHPRRLNSPTTIWEEGPRFRGSIKCKKKEFQLELFKLEAS